MTTRRHLLGALGGCFVGSALAGCRGDGTGGETRTRGEHEILAGPDETLSFRPERLTVEKGTTVTWRFVGPDHNVSAVPDHHPEVSLPDGAEPFASYEDDDRFATEAVGTTYSHAFRTPGEYVYACIPHATSGMVGTVRVEG
jgi:plastocyanin